MRPLLTTLCGIALGALCLNALADATKAAAEPAAQPISISNCFLWAIAQRRRHGGFTAVVRSQYWWGWHMLWSADLKEWWAFDPLAEKHVHPWWCPPALLFEGRPKLQYVGDGATAVKLAEKAR